MARGSLRPGAGMTPEIRLTLADFEHDEWKRAAAISTHPDRAPKFIWACYRSDFRTARAKGWLEVRTVPSHRSPHVLHLQARFTDRVERRAA